MAYVVRLGTLYLGGMPLFALTSDASERLRFTTHASAMSGVDKAAEKFQQQDLSGFIVEEIDG